MSTVKKDSIVSKPPELSVLIGWKDFAAEVAQKREWEYFVIDQFLKGNHNVRGNPNDNSIVVTKSSETINYPINKVYATFRAVRAFVTRHRPVAVFDPEISDPQVVMEARRKSALFERDNQMNNYKKICKEWVYFGVKYGEGIRQIGYDPVKKCCIRWTIDPNDFLVVQKEGEMENAPAVIKRVKRTVGYWRSKYPTDYEGKSTEDLAPDNELSDSQYKALSLQIDYPASAFAPAGRVEEQTTLGYECWYKLFEPNKLGGTINKVCFTKDRILSFEETPFNDYPFVSYKSDITPNQRAGEGAIKHIIAPQRMLNLLNTQMLEYNHIVNRGRFLKDKNAGFRVINTREGQIIEKNPGKQVQVLNPPAINPMLQTQINMANEYIEDIGGQHQASMGATPARVSSGDAIEALQLGDSNNISDLRDNFEDALEQEAAWVLKMYSLYEKDGFTMSYKKPDGTMDHFAVLGQQAYEKTGSPMPDQGRYYDEQSSDYYDYLSVLPENQIKVSITSQLGETRAAKLQTLLQLVPLGLPLQTVLQYLEFPNTGDIFERIASQELAQIQMDAMRAQMAPQPGQQPAGPPGLQGGGAPSGPPAPVGPDQAGGGPDIMGQLQSLSSSIGG